MLESTWLLGLLLALGFFLVCRLVARRQRHRLEIIRPKHATLIDEFLTQSAIEKLEFEPYTLGISPMMQTIVFILYEVFCQLVFPERFQKELIKLPDGGTLGLDWDGAKPDPTQKPQKPLLILIPGVGGDSDNMYQIALLKLLRAKF